MIDLKKFLHVDENSEANKLLCKHFRTEHYYSDGERVSFDSDTNKYYKYINGNREYLSSVYHKLETRRVVTVWSILSRLLLGCGLIILSIVTFLKIIENRNTIAEYIILALNELYVGICNIPADATRMFAFIKADPFLSALAIFILFLGCVFVLIVVSIVLDNIEITECRISKEKRDGDSNENP